MYIYIYIHIYTCIHAHTYIHVCIYIYTLFDVLICMLTPVFSSGLGLVARDGSGGAATSAVGK